MIVNQNCMGPETGFEPAKDIPPAYKAGPVDRLGTPA